MMVISFNINQMEEWKRVRVTFMFTNILEMGFPGTSPSENS